MSCGKDVATVGSPVEVSDNRALLGIVTLQRKKAVYKIRVYELRLYSYTRFP